MYCGDRSLSCSGDMNSDGNSEGVSAVAGELLGSCCMLRLALLVMRQLAGRGVSDDALRPGDVDVDGVLLGVGVLSDSSESFSSCDLPARDGPGCIT